MPDYTVDLIITKQKKIEIFAEDEDQLESELRKLFVDAETVDWEWDVLETKSN